MRIAEKHQLDEEAVDRIIGMAWEDRTTFDAIKAQFGVPEADVIKLMKQKMQLKNWLKWRARVQGRKTKHTLLRSEEVTRFKSKAQKNSTLNRISKKKY